MRLAIFPEIEEKVRGKCRAGYFSTSNLGQWCARFIDRETKKEIGKPLPTFGKRSFPSGRCHALGHRIEMSAGTARYMIEKRAKNRLFLRMDGMRAVLTTE